jgi:capsule polysaccharide export protein KpsE/RkpR
MLLLATWLFVTSLPREPTVKEEITYARALAAYQDKIASGRRYYERLLQPPAVPDHPFDPARFLSAICAAFSGSVVLGLARIVGKMTDIQ